jgi:hypothetical protein
MLFLEWDTFFFGTANRTGGKSSAIVSKRPSTLVKVAMKIVLVETNGGAD